MGVLGSTRSPSTTLPAKPQGVAAPAAREAGTAPGKAAPATAGQKPPAQQTLTMDMDPPIGMKTYTFPSKFRDVELLRAEFDLPTSVVQQWPLPRELKPASVDGVTKALVTFQTMGKPPDGMAPYHEAQFAVRVIGPDQKEGWHVLTMPVDSLENLRRGEKIFGYPKAMSEVNVSHSLFKTKGEAKTESGVPLFSLSVGPTFPIGRSTGAEDSNYQEFGGRTVRMASAGKGYFKLGLTDLEFSAQMRQRFPGLPASPSLHRLRSGILEDGEILLGLPEQAS